MLQGFLLGLANGTTCLAYCAPVLIPFLMGNAQHTRRNWVLLGQFLGGRLAGYLLFGFLAWLAHRSLIQDSRYEPIIYAVAYLGLGGMLLWTGLRRTPASCGGTWQSARSWLRGRPALLPLGLGFLTGLNLCPPFLLAFAGASQNSSPLNSLVFFALFFLGTVVYFLPFPLIGLFNRNSALQTVGKFAALQVSAYYLYTGTISLLGGLTNL